MPDRLTPRTAIAVLAFILQPVVWATPFTSAEVDDRHRFDNMLQDLPELQSKQNAVVLEKELAQAMKSIGEASLARDNDKPFHEQAELWAFEHARDFAAAQAEQEGQRMLSPYGHATVSLNYTDAGSFDGTGAQLLTPWQDKDRYLTFSQLGLQKTQYGAVANGGVGQRWRAGRWRVGYNAFVDDVLATGQQRGSLGAEAQGDYLRLSTNYYQPLSGWQSHSSLETTRMAQGYDVTTRGYLPFYRQFGASLSYERYLGQRVDLFNSGTLRDNPTAVTVGVNYTPVPLVTLSASHKEGEGGASQDQFTLRLNYRPGVALNQQLNPGNVNAVNSPGGSLYDVVDRNTTPVMSFRQRKSLSVFLATPPWQVKPGETLALKLQIRHSYPVKAVSWQGDTHALSLTPPANRGPDGWSIIIPAWDSAPGASNTYHLSVTIEDARQQRVTSNWITLKLVSPVTLRDGDTAEDDF